MTRKWLRLLSAWLCLVLILGQVPAIADDPAVDVSENAEVTSSVEVPEEPSSEEPPVSPTETEVPPRGAHGSSRRAHGGARCGAHGGTRRGHSYSAGDAAGHGWPGDL